MAVPLIVLYEIGIIGAKIFWQPRPAAHATDSSSEDTVTVSSNLPPDGGA